MQKYHIQLFADGAATAGADGVGTTAEGTVDTKVDGATGTQDAKEESFDDLINGRYKQDYQAKFEKALNKRMSKANAQIQEGIDFRNKLTPALENLPLNTELKIRRILIRLYRLSTATIRFMKKSQPREALRLSRLRSLCRLRESSGKMKSDSSRTLKK